MTKRIYIDSSISYDQSSKWEKTITLSNQNGEAQKFESGLSLSNIANPLEIVPMVYLLYQLLTLTSGALTYENSMLPWSNPVCCKQILSRPIFSSQTELSVCSKLFKMNQHWRSKRRANIQGTDLYSKSLCTYAYSTKSQICLRSTMLPHKKISWQQIMLFRSRSLFRACISRHHVPWKDCYPERRTTLWKEFGILDILLTFSIAVGMPT